MSEKSRLSRVPLKQWPHLVAQQEQGVRVDLSTVPGLFRAPAEWSVSAEAIEGNLLYHVVSGAFEATLGRRKIRVPAGSVLWVSSGQALQFARVDDRALVLQRFRLLVGSEANLTRPRRPWIHWQRLDAAEIWFTRIITEAEQPDVQTPMRLRGLLICLMVDMVRADRQPKAQRQLSEQQRRAIEEHVTEHLTIWPTVQELAQVVNLSADYFARMFRRTYGVPLRTWLVDQRIRMAQLYLAESTLSIGQVADQLGYEDVFFFSRQFKLRTGQTPSAYRRSLMP